MNNLYWISFTTQLDKLEIFLCAMSIACIIWLIAYLYYADSATYSRRILLMFIVVSTFFALMFVMLPSSKDATIAAGIGAIQSDVGKSVGILLTISK